MLLSAHHHPAARAARIEPLDEFEEWRLISAHYCISTAYKGAAGEGGVDLSTISL